MHHIIATCLHALYVAYTNCKNWYSLYIAKQRIFNLHSVQFFLHDCLMAVRVSSYPTLHAYLYVVSYSYVLIVVFDGVSQSMNGFLKSSQTTTIENQTRNRDC